MVISLMKDNEVSGSIGGSRLERQTKTAIRKLGEYKFNKFHTPKKFYYTTYKGITKIGYTMKKKVA